jgi:peptide/nickel transport system ATP-binding protein
MIAMALACEPKLLIADEPTTALDVTIQAQILDLIDDLRERLHMAVVLITHDMGVIAGRTDRSRHVRREDRREATTAELFDRCATPTPRPCWPRCRSSTRTPRSRSSASRAAPDLSQPIEHCRFAPRCRYATDQCRRARPELVPANDGDPATCFACFHQVGVDEEANVPTRWRSATGPARQGAEVSGPRADRAGAPEAPVLP